MSLEGSLETVALPEVLQLLSDTSKTGELLVRGDRGEGRLWFAGGRLSGFSVGRTDQPADAVFDLLRTGEGRFSFEADAQRADDAHEIGNEEVGPILEVAQARLAEWTEIVGVVPSMEHLVRLAEEAPEDGVNLDAGQWSLVVAVGEGRAVQEVLDRASLPEFDGCRSLKGLVDLGLLGVTAPPAPRKARSRKPAVIAEEPVEEALDEPVVNLAVEPVEEFVDEAVAESGDEVVVPEFAPQEAEFEHAAEARVEAHEEVGAYDHSGVEAQLDPGEFVFSAVDPDEAENPVDEVEPWNVHVADHPTVSDEDDFVPRHVPLPEPHDDLYEDAATRDHRAALEALIAEIPADEHETVSSHQEVPDGLADRGPWSTHELDEMSGWRDEVPEQAPVTSSSFYDTDPAKAPTGAARFHSYRNPASSYEEAWGVTTSDSDPVDEQVVEEEEETEPKSEPVNRGLLLKFLSSVRS